MFNEILDSLKSFVEAVVRILPSLEKLKPLLSELKLDQVVLVLEVVSKIIETVAELLGFASTNVEELGAKAERSGLNPDDFENYEDYIKMLNEFQLQPGELEEIPKEVRLARGLSAMLQQIETRFPVGVEALLPELITNRHGDFLTPNRIAALLNSFSDANLAIRDMVKYFDNQLGVADSLKVEDAMLRAEKKLEDNTGKSEQELLETIHQKWN